ncbi:uncharacterized protein LOC102373544 isoform X2 [Alligator sinensis]|uniref:Uncharacterized protein LOC102373544 isoform X2 n=1 Tax=Alligator sinensis TaxID=38654 RepID=A0A3Q0FWD9_ALLSI|nr:uncharacterized protein LOC102373544 isoform X2 [Alligator sinensis]
MVFTAAPSKAGGQRRTETWGICAATPVLCLLLGTAADVTEQENAKTEGAWTIAVIVIFILTIRGIAFYYRKWKSRKKKKTEICVRCSEGVQRLPKPATCIQQFVFWKRQLGHISVVIKGKVVHTRGEIHDYVYRSQEFLSPVSSRELVTAQELRSERMLLLGSVGTGISAISQQLLENWASGESKMAYSHVTTISFSDLNSIETPIIVKALLEQKCEQLLSVLSDQNSHEKAVNFPQ